MLAFGLAGCGAGSCNSFVDYLGMTLSRNLFLCYKHFIANRAMFAFGLAGFGAGGFNCRVDDLGVSRCGNLFCFGRMADRAGKGLYALVFAGRGGRNHALVPAVSLRGNLCLCHENLIANRAMFAFGLAGCGAGGVDCRVDDLGVSLRRNFLLCNDDRVADGAVFTLSLAGCGAGSCNSFVDYFRMPLSRNLFLCYKHFIANRAMLAFGLAGCGAGRLDPCVNDLSVSLGRDDLLCNDDLVTDRAMLAFGQSGLRAGGGDCRVDDLGVFRCGNSRAGAYFLAAILAVGIAGVAWLGAGCFLGITKFCVLMCARRAAPYAFDIVDNIASLGSLRLGVGAVGVVQLGGGDGD